MSDSRSGIGKTLLFAAIVTLAVTLIRLYGELNEWDPKYFSPQPGGGGAMVGIGWLMPIFGIVFGWKLARAGKGPANLGKALLMPLAGAAFAAGVIFVTMKFWQPSFWPMLIAVDGAGLLAGIIALTGWPRLGFVNLAYGLLARLPIVAITYFAFEKGWKVHHVGLAPNAPTDLTLNEKLIALCGAQLTIWIGATLVFGGLAGAIAAAIGGKRR